MLMLNCKDLNGRLACRVTGASRFTFSSSSKWRSELNFQIILFYSKDFKNHKNAYEQRGKNCSYQLSFLGLIISLFCLQAIKTRWVSKGILLFGWFYTFIFYIILYFSLEPFRLWNPTVSSMSLMIWKE